MKALARGLIRISLGIVLLALAFSALTLVSLIAMYSDRHPEALS